MVDLLVSLFVLLAKGYFVLLALAALFVLVAVVCTDFRTLVRSLPRKP